MAENHKKPFGLTNNALKLIAMVAMLADHIGVVLLPQYPILRIIGRLAFPIFAYMIAEGCTYTRKKSSYLGKIALLAVGCQVVYTVVAGSLYQSVLVSFVLSTLTIFAIDACRRKGDWLTWVEMLAMIACVIFLTVIAPRCFAVSGFYVDYGFLGVLLPVTVYLAPGKWSKCACVAVVMTLMGFHMGGVQWYGLLAVGLLLLYNGQRGKWNLKYLFYIFYPSHLGAIYLCDMLLRHVNLK